MSFLSRRRESCLRGRRGQSASSAPVGQGQSARAAWAQDGHPPPPGGTAGAPHGQLPNQLNRVYLSGVLVADPLPDVGRDGEPALIYLIAFLAPDPLDTEELSALAQQEVEVPARIAEEHGEELAAGDSIFVTGRLNGGGGILGTEVHSGPPPDDRNGSRDGSG